MKLPFLNFPHQNIKFWLQLFIIEGAEKSIPTLGRDAFFISDWRFLTLRQAQGKYKILDLRKAIIKIKYVPNSDWNQPIHDI